MLAPSVCRGGEDFECNDDLSAVSLSDSVISGQPERNWEPRHRSGQC